MAKRPRLAGSAKFGDIRIRKLPPFNPEWGANTARKRAEHVASIRSVRPLKDSSSAQFSASKRSWRILEKVLKNRNQGLRRRYASLALAATIAVMCSTKPMLAETFSAKYQARLAGISIGSAHLSGDVGAGTYIVSLKGDVSLLGLSTRFEASSRGTSRETLIVPAQYHLRTEGAADRSVTVNFSPDRVAAVSIDPAPTVSETRGLVPVEIMHRKNVLDPMSAMISEFLRVSQSENPCAGVAQVFTGNSRFDVDIVAGGAKSNEIVCRAVHKPIAGHRPSGNGRPTAAVVTFPSSDKTGGLRLPTRIEVPLSLGTVVIRRVS